MELAGSINTAAAIGGDASGDAAAGHRELNLFAVLPRINTYTAAELCGAADNIAADHGQLPAGCDIHTAATIYCDAERKRITRAAGDDAAGDGLCAACLVQHPQAVGVGRELVYCGGVAVSQRQIAAALDHNHAAFVCALIFEHMTVQVQRHDAVDGQGVADANVPCQLDGDDIRISNSRSQLIRGADFCYRLASAN